MERMCLGKIEFVIQHIVHPATGITLKVRTCAKLDLSVLIQIIVSLQNKTTARSIHDIYEISNEFLRRLVAKKF